MARIASQSKGGYYPTPTDEINLILERVSFTYTEDASKINVLDPCCGTGQALKAFADHIKNQITEFEIEADVATYGVELEQGRAEQAKEALDHIVHESYSLVRTEEKFGFMWLNPPYDEIEGERFELRFIRTLTSLSKNVLQRKGLLMFCIPQHVLEDTAAIIAERFTDVAVYRFTDAHFDEFNQVVVFGYYGHPNMEEERETRFNLKVLAYTDRSEFPTLADIKDNYIIPANKTTIEVFRAGKLNPKELALDLESSPIFQDFGQRVTAKTNRAIMQRPILPLKSTHAGIAVASGAVGGNLGTHIVSGVTKQVTTIQELYNDEGQLTGEKIQKFYSSAVRAFTPYGVHELN